MEAMTRGQRAFDDQPGSFPEITTNSGGITFTMVPPGTPNGERLVIRCDTDGEVWISIQTLPAPSKQQGPA
jgi:hypothetical protein